MGEPVVAAASAPSYVASDAPRGPSLAERVNALEADVARLRADLDKLLGDLGRD